MKRRRLLLGGLGLVAAIVLTLLAAGLWLVMTESGARFALEQAQAQGTFSAGSISGRLADAVAVEDVRFEGQGFSARVEHVDLDMDWSRLLAGSVTVERLATSVVHLRTEPDTGAREPAAEPAAGGAAAPRLPITIQIARASIEGIVLERPDEDIATGQVILSGAAAGTQADISRLETRIYGFYLSLQGQFDWSDELALDAVLSWSGDWLGSVHLTGTLAALAVEQELLEPFNMAAVGSVSLTPTPSVNLTLSWKDLSVPGFATLASAEGRADVVGSIDDFRVVVDSDLGHLRADGGLDPDSLQFALALDADGIEPGRWFAGLPGSYGAQGHLDGRLGGDYRVATDDLALTAAIDGHMIDAAFAGVVEAGTVAIDQLALSLGANRIAATGRVGSELDLAIEAELGELAAIAELAQSDGIAALISIDPRALALRGDASASLSVTGDWRSPAVGGDLRLANARYLDLPFALDASLHRTPDSPPRYAIESFEATLGATRVTGRGSVGSRLDLMLEIGLDDLAEVSALIERDEMRSLTGFDGELAPLAGSADLSLRLTGAVERPTITADLSALAVSYDRWSIDRASADVDFDTAPGGRADLTVEVDAPEGSLRLAAAGRFGEQTWRGRLERLTLEEPVLGGWQLEDPAALELGPGLVDLEQSCLRNVSSSVCLRGRYGTGADEIELSAQAFDLETLAPLIPELLSITGLVDLEATLAGLSTDAPRGSLSVRSRGTEIGFDSGASALMTTIDSLAIDASLDNYALSLKAELEGPATGRAVLAMSSGDVRDNDAPIEGSLEVHWSDLSAAAALTPDIGAVGGTLDAALNVSGSTRNPQVDGSAQLVNGSLSIPQWGVAVDRIDGSAMSPDGRRLEFSGTAFVEDGEVQLSGATELSPDAGWPTSLRLTGDSLPIVQRPDMTVIASPDLDNAVELPSIEVSGTVTVPRADIRIAELPAQAVRVSSDAIVHTEEAVAAQRPLQLHADIDIVLGDEVHYEASNLNTDLTGALRLDYQSGLSPTATGNVGVAGTYETYGQTLQLERGQLMFAGPLEDPGLDIRAVRYIGEVTAGIHLGGTLLAPDTTVFSEPTMREADALAYLLFGRPIRASEEEQTQAIESTALALGLQALPIVDIVGDSLGLDELSIGANEFDSSALMAGKYLSPKVYLSYTYGLFNRLGGFLLRYDINERFSLETRSGSEKSMDLLYSVEKD